MEPVVARPTAELATDEQRQDIIRLINHPVITRQEKTKALLAILRLTKVTARQLIGRLRDKIQERTHTPTEEA